MPIDPDLDAIIDRPEPSAEVIEAPEAPAELEPIEVPEDDGPELAPADLPEARDPVPWSEYEKLRHENADYRKRWQPIEQTFSKVHPDDAAALLSLVETYANDPAQAAEVMRSYAEALAANGGEAVMDTADEEDYLTASQVERMLTEREQRQAEAAAVAQIERDAVTLGYNPESEDYVALLHLASKNGGDLQAADAALKAKVQKQVEAELAKLRDMAQVPTPQIGGSAPSAERQINNVKEAASALYEQLGY